MNQQHRETFSGWELVWDDSCSDTSSGSPSPVTTRADRIVAVVATAVLVASVVLMALGHHESSAPVAAPVVGGAR